MIFNKHTLMLMMVMGIGFLANNTYYCMDNGQKATFQHQLVQKLIFFEQESIKGHDVMALQKLRQSILDFFKEHKDSIKKYASDDQRELLQKQLYDATVEHEKLKQLEEEKKAREIKKKSIRHPSLTTWITMCDKLKKNPFSYSMPAVDADQFLDVIDDVKTIMAKQLDTATWLNNSKIDCRFYLDDANSTFKPFAKKFELLQGCKTSFMGDLHGDIHSINEYLKVLMNGGYLDENFRIIHDKFYMVFLGDYTDRGKYGIETFYTVMRLKKANPDNVILVRGNHEDRDLNADYGFTNELATKFRLTDDELDAVYKVYDVMPVVLYLGCNGNFIQCCHGGMEVGFSPSLLLDFEASNVYAPINQLMKKTNVQALCSCSHGKHLDATVLSNLFPKDIGIKGTIRTGDVGFMWDDFIFDDGKNLIKYVEKRGIAHGKPFTQALLKSQSTQHSKIVAVFRAHQHGSETMKPYIIKNHGLYQLWTNEHQWCGSNEKPVAIQEGHVFTFNVAPCSNTYGKDFNYNFATFAILTVDKDFSKWVLQPYKLPNIF